MDSTQYLRLQPRKDIMDNRNENFMDPKTLTAIILVAVVFIGWQSYMSKKYPPVKPAATAASGTDSAANQLTQAQAQSQAADVKVKQTPGENDLKIESNQKEETMAVTNGSMSFQLSSLGMAIKNFQLNQFTDRSKSPIRLGEAKSQGLFEVRLVNSNKPLEFILSQPEPNLFVGTHQNAEFKITQILRLNEADNTISSRIKVEGIEEAPPIQVLLTEEYKEYGSSSFLLPSTEHQEFVMHGLPSNERINITASKEPIEKSVTASDLSAISSQYFTVAMVNKSDIKPDVKAQSFPGNKLVTLQAQFKPAAIGQSYEVASLYYLGPKSITQLQKIDEELVGVLSLGFFSGIAKLLLNLLLWFEKFVSNWGVAIVLLTLLVRALVLPFNVMSYKSMKRMQQIQPLLTSLRERYKDDAQALNREMMRVMKENKVNPLGGCLPMLLQMPVFFALYQVLGQSVELYQAPFIFWIHDLSLKDPYYVLPALMGVAMYVQQKITPTTMDPAQAKVMQFLPIIFSLMMISLPSGLTLYIFISTLFGVIQQQIFMRDNQPVKLESTAKA